MPRRMTLPRRRSRLAVLVAGLLAAGCGGGPLVPVVRPAATAGSPSLTAPSAGAPAPAPSLGGAEALVFSNRYVEADSAYRRLAAAAPRDAAVHASYALFLTYRLQPAAARDEAVRAVTVDPTSARAHAVLCRVDDWASRFGDAVTEGHRAVALGPGDVLAHLFLSEALADQGDVDGARVELGAARLLVSDASSVYERAEVHREEGNLDRDRGDVTAQLAAFLAAYHEQPGWSERASELASAYLDGGDLTGAHNAVDTALTLAPDDADLLTSLTRISLYQSDYATAERAIARLVSVRPRDAGDLVVAAQVAVAAHGDLDTAVDDLQRAIAAAPSDPSPAAYLIALETLVHGDPARGHAEVAAALAGTDDGRPGGPRRSAADPAGVEADHAARALAAVNAAREHAGLPAVPLDDRLSASAASHCFYWLFNNASPTVADLGIHSETPGLLGFRGARPGDRAAVAGWHDGPVGEDITHTGTPQGAVAQWVDSVYHRFPVVRQDLGRIGYADCAAGPLPMEDMEFGFSAPPGGPSAPVVYPGDGQTGVPAIFRDNELPDPVPSGKPRVTGYPVTVTFAQGSRVSAVGLSLAGPSGPPLEGYRLDPSPATESSASLLPVAPLAAHSHYTATVTATVDGVPYTRTWGFDTA